MSKPLSAPLYKPLSFEKPQYRYALLLGMLLLIFAVSNSPADYLGGAFIHAYVVQPVLWCLTAYLVWWLPRPRAAGKLRLYRLINLLALICAGCYVLAMIVGGMLNGFGKSPYSFTPLAIINNIIFVGTSLVGMEYCRAFLINNLARRRATLAIILVSLLFTALNLSLSKISILSTGSDIVQYVGGDLLPLITENIFASFFAYLAGPIPAILYRGAISAFEWFCPVLPDLKWMTKAFIGVLAPSIGLLLVQRVYLVESREMKKATVEKENPAGWIVTCIASVLMVWFSAGLFPVYPSVILSGSMEPMIKKGDLVLMKKITGLEANTGDVVQYRYQSINITHRIIKAQESSGARVFVARGDANSGPDPDLVKPEQVKGKVIKVLPKLGWVNLALREFLGGRTPHGVEF